MNDDTAAGRDSSPGTPRWVKVFGVITLVVVLLFVILKFAGGGGHGPRRHMPHGDAGAQTSHQSGDL